MSVREDSELRVCSSCGKLPGTGLHCQSCGANLLWRRQLPTRAQWLRRSGQTAPEEQAPASGPRYTSRQVREKQRGSAPRLRRTGQLMLLLSLNELGRDEDDLLGVFHASDPLLGRCWLVVTSSCLLYIPNLPAVAPSIPDPIVFELKELEDITPKRRLGSSRISFVALEKQFSYTLKGPKDASELSQTIGEARG